VSVVEPRFTDRDVIHIGPGVSHHADPDLHKTRFRRIRLRTMADPRSLSGTEPGEIYAQSGLIAEECRFRPTCVLVNLVGLVDCPPQTFIARNEPDSDPSQAEEASNDVTTQASVPQSPFPAEQLRLETHWLGTRIGAGCLRRDTAS